MSKKLNTQNLKAGFIYIVEDARPHRYKDVEKIKVLEITKYTILYCHLDTERQSSCRKSFDDFNHTYNVIENLGESEQLQRR